MNKTLLPALLCAAALTGCQTTPMDHSSHGMLPVPASGLTATQWKVTQIDGVAVPSDYAGILQFQPNGTLSGSWGCNNGTAQYQHNGHLLSIRDMMSTKMACGQLDWENRLARALAATQHVQLTATNGLALYDAQMKPLVLLKPRP